MFKNVKPVLVLCTGIVLSACAQQEEPAPIMSEPIFDKYGNATGECQSAGYTDPTTGAYSPPQRVPCPPPDECVEPIPGTAARVPCTPPPDDCDPQVSTYDPNCQPRPGGEGGRRPDPQRPNQRTPGAIN